MNCPQCNASFSCNCQTRTASDGTICCSNCLQSYEMNKTVNKVVTGQPATNNFPGTAPVVNSITYNAPE